MKKYLTILSDFFFHGRDKSTLQPLGDWMKHAKNKTFFNDLNQLWEGIRMRASLFNPDKEKAWLKIQAEINKTDAKTKRHKFHVALTATITSAAAVAVILLSVWFAHDKYFSKEHQFVSVEYVTYSGKSEILLPDGSKVWLKSHSSLLYSESKRERTATLQGEGYFDVSKKSKKFKVSTEGLDVVVYGTKFNVISRKKTQNIEVALLEGSVALKNMFFGEQKLLPGELAIYDKKSEKGTITHFDTESAANWTAHTLKIEHKSFEELAIILSNWYQKAIDVSDELKDVGKYTFTITDESLYDVINLLSKTHPIDYKEHSDGRIVISKKKE